MKIIRLDVLGLDNLKDTADISNSISRLVSSSLDYEVFNFVFDSGCLMENLKIKSFKSWLYMILQKDYLLYHFDNLKK